MFERIKVYYSRKFLLNKMKANLGKCVCGNCLHQSMAQGYMPIVCNRLNLPCVALKGKYVSKKGLYSLLENSKMLKDKIVIPYNENYISIHFLESVQDNYLKKSVKEDGNG